MIAREMTKIHETFYRTSIDNFKGFESNIKGELTIVISEIKSHGKIFNKDKIINKAKNYLKKYSLKDTVELIFEQEQTNKKEIYETCLKNKK